MYKLLLSVLLFNSLLCANETYGQAKSSIGLGPSISHFGKPSSNNSSGIFRNYPYERKVGFGGVLQGEIKLSRAFSLAPSLGAENESFAYFGLSGKIYASDKLNIHFGAIAYFADAFTTGFGPSIGLGYQLLKVNRNSLDLDLHGEMANPGNGDVSLLGLRLTYNFSLSKRK